MQKCLGIYIEDNLIKYAKVSKNRDDMKVESFGVNFFQDLNTEIPKIIEETHSINTPISINLANEKYLYFDIFALLSKKDIEKTVQTEFENFCDEKNQNKEAFETRFALMPKSDDKEKVRALDIYANKIEIERQTAPFEKYRLTTLIPVSVAIGNIARLAPKQNQLIVNMENETTITTIYDNQIYSVETLNIGSKEILNSINQIENSYAKAYEICKNTTINTAEASLETEDEEQIYLQSIMPTIYKIAEETQRVASESINKINTIYLTGTLAAINNIELYFQELLPNIECTVLKPNLIDETTSKINVKDYIEVNSAIALATVGLGKGIQELNFKKANMGNGLASLLSIELPGGKNLELKKEINMSGPLDNTEMWLARAIGAILIVLLMFIIFSKILSNQMLAKEKEINSLIASQNEQIALANSDNETINSKTEKYKNLIADMKRINAKISDTAARRNLIPNLLNQIMSSIPDKVQLAQITNTKDKSITIKAQSYDYDQLGYFISIIKTKRILKNVVSYSGIKNGGIVTVTIEGELP